MASLALPLIGMGAQLITGLFGRSAAHKAADIQRQRQDAAANNIERAQASQAPQVTGAAQRSGDRAMDAAYTGASGVDESARRANMLLDPYANAGGVAANRLQNGIADGGEFTQTFAPSDLTTDPSYQWRLDQGMKALERSAAARGGATGGGATKDITNYAQGAASQEFQAAFNRFRQDRQDKFANVFGVAGMGQKAAETQGGNLTDASKFGSSLIQNASQYAGNADMNATQFNAGNELQTARDANGYRIGAGDAEASGIVGGHNAIAQGVGGAINTGMSAYYASKIPNYLKNPAAYGYGGGGGGGYTPLPAGGIG